MPQYEFECMKCGKEFTVEETMTRHEEHHQVKCPKCGSSKVEQRYGSVFVKTSKKS